MTKKKSFVSAAVRLALAVTAAAVAGGVAAAEKWRDRWIFMARAVVDDADVDFITNTVDRAAECGFNGMMLAGMDNVGRWPEWRLSRLEAVRLFCAEKSVEIVPMVWSVGYGTMLDRDVNLAEGIEVASVPYVRRGAKAVFSPAGGTDLLRGDGSFERTVQRGGKTLPAGWDAWDKVGTVVAVDENVSFAGGKSMRLSAFGVSDGGQARLLRSPLKLAPGRQYAVTGRVKVSEDFAPRSAFRVTVMQNGNCISLTSVLGGAATNGWVRFSVPLVLVEEGDVGLYVGTWEAKKGAAWVDEVKVEDLGLCGVLRRGGCPFTVKDAVSGKVYREGRDYGEVSPVESVRFPRNPKSLELSIPDGSAICEGTKLLVSGYVPVTVKNGLQCAACMSERALYRHFADSAKGVKKILDPKTWFISMDEIRMGGTCAACRAKKTDMAHILGECVTLQHAIIRRVSPQARICIWGDMFNPAQNAKDRYYCCRGSFKGSWKLIPRDIVIVDWYGAKYSESLPFWRREGFNVISATYYDAPFDQRAAKDIAAAAAYPNVQGAVYTTWRSDYSALEKFAALLKGGSRGK